MGAAYQSSQGVNNAAKHDYELLQLRAEGALPRREAAVTGANSRGADDRIFTRCLGKENR